MNEEYRGLYGVIVDRHRLRKSKLRWLKSLIQNTLTGPLLHAVVELIHG
jgi:hypothetical protein